MCLDTGVNINCQYEGLVYGYQLVKTRKGEKNTLYSLFRGEEKEYGVNTVYPEPYAIMCKDLSSNMSYYPNFHLFLNKEDAKKAKTYASGVMAEEKDIKLVRCSVRASDINAIGLQNVGFDIKHDQGQVPVIVAKEMRILRRVSE